MSDVPDWVGRPYAPVHADPALNYQWTQLSQDQQRAMRDKLVESFIQSVVQAIRGLFVPTGQPNAAFDQLAEWATDLLMSLFGVDAIGTVVQPSAIPDITLGMSLDMQGIVDGVVNFFSGWAGANWQLADANTALQSQATTTAALSAAVAALQNDSTNQAVGGVSAFIDFSDRADATGIGTDFTQTYDGTGTSYLGIKDGLAAWYPVVDADRVCDVRYNVTATVTDYQKVGGAFASAPMWDASPTLAAINYIYGRMNAAGDEGVYVKFTWLTCELGCVAGGVRTVFDIESIVFKPNGLYWLVCGTVGGARVFQVLDGAAPIMTYTDAAAISQMGSGYRETGFGGIAQSNGFVTNIPGAMSAFGFSDNYPPTYVGSGAEMYRASASGVSVVSGVNLLVSSFFDTDGPATIDYDVDKPNAKFTVSLDGWYDIDARAKTSGVNFPNNFTFVLFVNGTAYQHGGDGHGRTVNSLGGAQFPQGISGHWRVPLEADDYVELGYDSTDTVSNVLTGDAALSETRFTIALNNRSTG